MIFVFVYACSWWWLVLPGSIIFCISFSLVRRFEDDMQNVLDSFSATLHAEVQLELHVDGLILFEGLCQQLWLILARTIVP